jgi:hypothetical protein
MGDLSAKVIAGLKTAWTRAAKAWSSSNAVVERHARALLILEIIAAVSMLVFALPYLFRYVHAMATTSLWNDELYTIMHFSSQGAVRTMTDYHVPNNHIFFNLVNAIIPGSGSYDPLRARFWSLVFMAAVLALVAAVFLRRKLFFEGALMFHVIAVNRNLLDLSLQARGYGFLCFCAMATSVLMLRHLSVPRKWSLILISLLTVLGTWTVPSYVLFSGPLMLLLWLWTRSRQVAIAGAAALAAVLLLYLPVLEQLVQNARTYGETWGYQYAGVEAVFRTVRNYLLNQTVLRLSFKGSWAIPVFLTVAVIVPVMAWRHKGAEARAVRILLVSVFLFFVFNMILKTPRIRTTGFVVLPLALCFVIRWGRLLKGPRLGAARLLVLVIAAVFFPVHSLLQAGSFDFTPIENWMGAARYIEKTFPEGMEVHASFRGYFLRAYLDESYPTAGELNSEKFVSGSQVVVDSNFKAKRRFDPKQLAPAAVAVRIPQRRGEFMSVCFVPPSESFVESVHTADGRDVTEQAGDRDATTSFYTARFRAVLRSGVRYRSLVLSVRDPAVEVKVRVKIKFPDREGVLQEQCLDLHGDAVTIALGDGEIEYIDVQFSAEGDDFPVSIDEMWAYPANAAHFSPAARKVSHDPDP